jgi:hypothetical protein
MEQNAILLNGGRDHDVVPLEGADAFLVRLLGAAPARPAVTYLRSAQTAEGKPCVGVFIGNRHVGYLALETSESLRDTVKACEMNGSVARARGNLIASWDCPGQVKVKVSLADAEHLLCAPEPEPQEQRATNPAVAVDATAPPLSAGYTEDYPDWPPPKPTTEAPAPAGSFFAPAAPAEEAPSIEPALAPPRPATAGSFFAPAAPQPAVAASEAPTNPPPQAPAATHSASLGGTPVSSQTPQSGWLSSSVKSAQGSTASATGAGAALGGATTSLEQDQSWQSLAERRNTQSSPEEEVIAAWTSSPARAQPTAPSIPRSTSGRTKTWILSALLVVVLVAAAVLVWKLVFAPKTYTDPDYGYSFSYPGRWEFIDQTGMREAGIAGTLVSSDLVLNVGMAGHGDTFSLSDFAAVSVTVFDAKLFGDPSQLGSALQGIYSQTAAAAEGYAILQPVTPASVGGLNGYRTTLSYGSGSDPGTVTYCFLLDTRFAYVLSVMATPSTWPTTQKTFDKFFESFEPGAAKM